MEKEKGKLIDTKQRNISTVCHSEKLRRKETSRHHQEIFFFDSSSDFDSDSSMTKDIVQDRKSASQPITIPGSKVAQLRAMKNELLSLDNSPTCSVGDSVYNSPRMPQTSKDFDNVLLNLRDHDQVKRVSSCDDVVTFESDSESRGSPFPMSTLSASLPSQGIKSSRKGRRTVHFDEATITATADLGESAARFRMLWRKKKGLVALSCPRFGESKTITVQHEENEKIPSPQLERKEKNKSIFGICNYSSYGRYT